ncbi:fatty acid desaturase [Aestuariispira ectoiniformans]|uniref:fatty acid desaturase n=1 Tax=Aestuariispira ectoiniformans TaxID=2775080 RepID=UPI00223B6B54|nr:fatty acid desaturase [Aestuariispira ectoiniformans]
MKSFWDRCEIPTWLVIVTVHLGWFLLTYFRNEVPIAMLVTLGATLTCWHMHLQHEILHGHPTRWKRLNEVFAYLPAALWLPYPIYRDSHIIHHETPELTTPGSDPESYYWTAQRWQSLPWPVQQLLTFNNSVLGRFLIGPFLTVGQFWYHELQRFGQGNFRSLPAWLGHAVVMTAMILWLTKVCDFPIGLYILTFAWPGTALALLRSYLEHRPAPNGDERTAIVENSPVFSLLFLNNNYHVIHHDHPGMPWYRITAFYRANRAKVLEKNGGYVFDGYYDVFRQYLLVPKDLPSHPGPSLAASPLGVTAVNNQAACDVKP